MNINKNINNTKKHVVKKQRSRLQISLYHQSSEVDLCHVSLITILDFTLSEQNYNPIISHVFANEMNVCLYHLQFRCHS